MNTKYSNWKMWYYVLCMVLTLQLAACSEETHDEYTAAPEIEDTYIDQLDALIAEMTDLQQNSDYGDKKGQYPTESRAILTDAIDDANRAVLLIKYQQCFNENRNRQSGKVLSYTSRFLNYVHLLPLIFGVQRYRLFTM